MAWKHPKGWWKMPLDERIPFWMERSTTNEHGCWLFQGALNEGYGSVGYQGRTRLLHKLVWEHFHGPVPDGLELDHLCRNRNCWNDSPRHLETVTRSVNIKRGDHWGRKKTHCPRGHEYSVENTRVEQGRRHCRPCDRIAAKQSNDAKREKRRNVAMRDSLHRAANTGY